MEIILNFETITNKELLERVQSGESYLSLIEEYGNEEVIAALAQSGKLNLEEVKRFMLEKLMDELCK